MKAAAEEKNLKIVNFGDIMFDEAKALGIKERDDLRKAPLLTQKRAQRIATMKLAALDDIIIDTHLMVQTPKGYLPGLPATVLQRLEPKTIFVVEAPPHEILSRRQKDPSRHRDNDSEELIALHQQLNRIAAVSIAAMSGATIRIILNADGRVEEAARDVLETL
jgi:adenylate kinase